jgi:membrane associated rhomboid family serine protease
VLPLKDNVPTRTFPVVTIGLIVANSLIWLWEWRTGVEHEVIRWGYYPCEVQGPCQGIALHHQPLVETVFSSMFMHAGWIHILGNMLFLWIFGNNIEDALGRVRFLLWYLAGGIAALALQTFVTLQFASRPDASIPNIGASGAIAAVLGAYFVLLPTARVLTAVFLGFFFFFVELPALLFLGVWIGLQILSGGAGILHPQSSGGTAFFAHIGGFAFGVLTVYLVAKRRPLRPSW